MKKVKEVEYDVDELGGIQILEAKTLAKVARGEIDLNQIAILELTNRGLDENGKWVGFQKSKDLFIEQ